MSKAATTSAGRLRAPSALVGTTDDRPSGLAVSARPAAPANSPSHPPLADDRVAARSTPAIGPALGPGQTVALVGSSGVGKSTLVNRLAEGSARATGDIREHDARGRHTTTSREMIAMSSGAWLVDTPGMRELKVGAAEAGLAETFADLEALAAACRFRDCAHGDDPGCELREALRRGEVDARRLANYLKLGREAAEASRSLRERRERDRRLGRKYKRIQAQRRRDKGRD